MRYLNLEEVIYLYSEIVQRSGTQPGIKDESLLDSILAKPMVAFEGEELYPDIFTKVAVLMYAIINSKPFASANKPTALVCALFLLRANGYHILATQESLVELAEGTEQGRYKVDHLVNWFRKNATPA
jgi:death-on-curing protein